MSRVSVPAQEKILETGRPWPLGAHWDGAGVNFALFSAHAARVELCLFEHGREYRLRLPGKTDQVWHGYLPGARPGLCYGYRVHGPDRPDDAHGASAREADHTPARASGHRFEPQRLLLDPYARELAREPADMPQGADLRAPDANVRVDGAQTAPATSSERLFARVVHAPFDWGDDAPPDIPLADSVIYEVHVKGATRAHPGVPEAQRGAYAGLAAPAMLHHFKKLGVTAIELLPVHAFIDEPRLAHGGLKNYWGYNTLAFFAPEARYATQDAQAGDCGERANHALIDEFRTMVRTLHKEGIEVILDVVFNHTAEGDEFGPTLSFRGIDNASYYRLPDDDPTRYENFSGCGNTLNLAHPRVLQLVMDALRYWVEEMHVDGFRFDLATALTRESAFLAAIRQDPTLQRVKLIAEPWDLGMDGYRLGGFPPGWSEWNDRFRDDVRAFWLTGEAGIGALAQRLAGSSEIFRHDGRTPQAGVNFITAHDGFTLRDLLSYQHKHNEANGEDNRDGHSHNLSWNCGAEGESDDPAIIECRRRLQRALLATLFAAQGVPMLQGGDEIGRTQRGNNNAYCQDNPLTWLDWTRADTALLDFTAGLIALRRRLPQLRRRVWLSGRVDATVRHGRRDVVWQHADGREMRQEDWQATRQDTLGCLLDDPAAGSLLLLFNRHAETRDFILPPGDWQTLCDTAADAPFAGRIARARATLAGRSVQWLSQPRTQCASKPAREPAT